MEIQALRWREGDCKTSHQARQMCLSWHDDFSNTRLGCPARCQRSPHVRDTNMQVNQATWLGFRLQKFVDVQRHNWGQTSIWMVLPVTWEYKSSTTVLTMAYLHWIHGNFLAKKYQGLSFAGVCTHHQNGIAKQRIWELQEMTQTMLIHTQHWWPGTISANISMALFTAMATDALNATPSLKFKNGQTPLESFASTNIARNPKHWHHFGCPAYTLSQEIQTDTSIHHKWKARSRVGVCTLADHLNMPGMFHLF